VPRQSQHTEPADTRPAALRIRLLGGFEVEVSGQPISTTAWRLRKALDLVKLLALTPGHQIHREQLVDILWPDKDPAAGTNNLYQALHAARVALGSDGARLLRVRNGMVRLGEGQAVWTDAESYERAVRRAADGTAGALEEARDLYRGDLLSTDPYADWAIARREALRSAQIRVLRDLALSRERLGVREAALELLREALLIDPLDEETQRHVIRLEGHAGHRGAAARQFEALRASLRSELDVEPAEETIEAYRTALKGSPVNLPAQVRSNLPERLTSFVGRGRELREVELLLQSTRLLTLTGTGGTGKTRLAEETVRRRLDDYPDGAWVVELASVEKGLGVPRAVADALGIQEPPGTGLASWIATFLSVRRLLLLLDNCEHVVDGVASLATELLRVAPHLTILTTSRQPLRIPGEVLFRVPSLTVGDPVAPLPLDADLPEAVQLFVERARSVKSSFNLSAEISEDIARLCYHLDGLPLALELAASRVGAISVGTLLERLDQRFTLLVASSRPSLTRHQTLEATLDWSYNLLTDEERRVLRWLSVFAQGSSADTIEAVCAEPGDGRGRILAIVANLVDQSLVILDDSFGEPRYRMLETVRQYARDRLVREREEGDATRRALEWAIAFARAARHADRDGGWLDGLRRIEREHENLRAILEQALLADPPGALALAEALWPTWLWKGQLVDGRRWLMLALSSSAGPAETRVAAMLGLGALLGRSGDPRRHATLAEEAAVLARQSGDLVGEGRARQSAGIAHWAADQLDLANTAFVSSLEIAGRIDAIGQRSAALACLSVVRAYLDDRPRAYRLLDESIDLLGGAPGDRTIPAIIDLGEALVTDDVTGRTRLVFEQTFASFREMLPGEAIAHLLCNRARFARESGDHDRARADLQSALWLSRSVADQPGIAHALAAIGPLEAELGDKEAGRLALEESLAIRTALGDVRGASLAAANLGNLEAAAGRRTEAARLLSDALMSFRRRGDAWGLAATLANLGSLALRQGDRGDARRLYIESLEACRSTGRKRWVAWTLMQLGALADGDGKADEWAREALAIFEAIGERRGEAEARALLGAQRLDYVDAKVDHRTSERSQARRAAHRPN
jgi:predicted ATPase/DNA-binding SARP family transcriptional activator